MERDENVGILQAMPSFASLQIGKSSGEYFKF